LGRLTGKLVLAATNPQSHSPKPIRLQLMEYIHMFKCHRHKENISLCVLHKQIHAVKLMKLGQHTSEYRDHGGKVQ
jgi:hypothetical protein